MLASVSSATNALWPTEWLAEALDLRPGMRVLDLGCGPAMTSIFLRREFDAQVWVPDRHAALGRPFGPSVIYCFFNGV